ncbi:MAG: hypothetical protein ACYC44_00365 [Patescibacteria group bacterium]
MSHPFRAFGRWLKARYGDKPTKVQVGSPPYRGTEQEIPSSTHLAVLVWRMTMEGTHKTANSFFHYWKTIIFLALLVGLVMCYRPIAASIKIWAYRQEQKAALAAMEAASAQAEKAKLDEARAQAAASASASAQAEKAKFAEAAKVAASAQAEKAKPADAQGDGGVKQPRAFYVSERYWVCIHKVVNCLFNNQGNQYDPNNVVKCDPAYSTTGGGFGSPHCPEGDSIQTTLVLNMDNKPVKIIVPNDVYGKHDPGTWVFLMCDQQKCCSDQDKCVKEVVDPPTSAPPASAVPSASSPSSP